MKVEYSSNNSGGTWWLSDEDWYNLEKEGWKVGWVKDYPPERNMGLDPDGRWLGALARSAVKENAKSEGEAIAEWERIVGQSADDEGCPCCGQPHNFYVYDDDEEIY